MTLEMMIYTKKKEIITYASDMFGSLLSVKKKIIC